MNRDIDGDSPFAPPPSSAVPTLLIALGIGVVSLAIYWVVDGGSPQPTAAPALQTPVAQAPGTKHPPASLAGNALPAEPQTEPTRQRVEAKPVWTRCEGGGKVSYSDTGCTGAVQTSSSQTTHAALTTVPKGAGSANTATIYRCKAYSGVEFWSGNHCHLKKALVDRMVEVPRGLPFKQQVVVAERSMPRVPASASASSSAPREAAVSQGPTRQEQCAVLKKAIDRIDAHTRQPLTAWEQDQWRSERQKVRDGQFALRC